VINLFLHLRQIIGTGISIGDTISIYLDPILFGEIFWDSTIWSLVGIVIGVFCAWGWISRTDKGQLLETQAAFDEAVPLERERTAYRDEETETTYTE